MASSVCAFAVSPAPATSFISPPLYRTSRQWRCVYSARQQKEPVRRLRKGPARFVVVLADEESDVQLGISRKRPPFFHPVLIEHCVQHGEDTEAALRDQIRFILK